MKEKTIVFDSEISVQEFYRAFYRHIESTSFAADKGRYRHYWHGEVHPDGTFEVGYHYPDLQRRRLGESHLTCQIGGCLAHENGKTMVRYYQSISSDWLIFLVFSAMVLQFGLTDLLMGDWTSLLLIFIFGGFCAYSFIFGTKAYRNFPKILEKIIHDIKNPPQEEF